MPLVIINPAKGVRDVFILAQGIGRAAVIRVVVVDDSLAARRGLRMSLDLEPDVEVVGEGADGEEALKLAQKLGPEVVVMDVKMPGMDGIEAAGILGEVAPDSAVVILTLYDDAPTRARAQEAGAKAFVSKHGGEEELMRSIREVMRERR